MKNANLFATLLVACAFSSPAVAQGHGAGHGAAEPAYTEAHPAPGHELTSHEAAFDQTSVSGDEARITGLLKEMFETENSQLTVAPILIDGDEAIIGWSQDGRGGRALLRRDAHGLWRVSICAGDGLKGEENMLRMGIEPAVAARLAAAQAEAEAALDPAHAEQFALFDQELFFDDEANTEHH